MDAAAASQINVRMDAKLKAEGDDALAKAGFTTTKAVRALWELAAALGDAPEDIVQLLTPEASAKTAGGGDKKREESLAAAGAGSKIFATALEASGINVLTSSASQAEGDLAYADLRDRSLRERLGERELLS